MRPLVPLLACLLLAACGPTRREVPPTPAEAAVLVHAEARAFRAPPERVGPALGLALADLGLTPGAVPAGPGTVVARARRDPRADPVLAGAAAAGRRLERWWLFSPGLWAAGRLIGDGVAAFGGPVEASAEATVARADGGGSVVRLRLRETVADAEGNTVTRVVADPLAHATVWGRLAERLAPSP